MGYEKHQRTYRWQTYRLSRFGAGFRAPGMPFACLGNFIELTFVSRLCVPRCVPSVLSVWLRAYVDCDVYLVAG